MFLVLLWVLGHFQYFGHGERIFLDVSQRGRKISDTSLGEAKNFGSSIFSESLDNIKSYEQKSRVQIR